MVEQDNIQVFEINTQVRLETIRHGIELVNTIKRVTGETPEHLGSVLDAMQCEYNKQTKQ